MAIPAGLADFRLRTSRRFVQIEGAQQATVLAAQAFTSLIPFLVVAAAVGPGDDDLVLGFVAVVGAVVGAVVSELYGDRIDRLARRRVHERAA